MRPTRRRFPQPDLIRSRQGHRSPSWQDHAKEYSLHLVECVGEGLFELEGFLDFISTDIGIFPVFQEARTMVVPHELDEPFGSRLPVFWKAFEVFKGRADTALVE